MLCRCVMVAAICLAPLVASGQPAEPGQQTFNNMCAGCHGLDGRGGEHAPNIATSPDVQQMEARELTSIIQHGIEGAGMPAFQSLLQPEQIHDLVTYLRKLGNAKTNEPAVGDADRGKSLFFGSARCGECHSIRGQGGFLGDDLSGFGKNHSPEAIRRAIMNPDPGSDTRHGTVAAVTREGKTYTGIARNEDNFSLQMQTADGAFHLFDKRDLVRIEHTAESLMPSGYGKTLTQSELADLVRYLSASTASQDKEQEDDDE